MNYEKSVFISDLHIPFHDIQAVNITFKFIEEFQPQYLFLVGDLMDFYAISSFDKNPKRILSLQSEIDVCQDVLAKMRNICPDSSIIYIEGNHENRLTRYLWRHPEISSLKALSLENLLELQKYKIQYKPINTITTFHKFLIEHGDIIRKHSGYTAKAEMEKRGISGLSGHSHRLSTHYLTNMAGDHIWLENGCLCKRNPEYIIGIPNWQQGFTIGYFKDKKERFSVEQICITHGKLTYAGKEYR